MDNVRTDTKECHSAVTKLDTIRKALMVTSLFSWHKLKSLIDFFDDFSAFYMHSQSAFQIKGKIATQNKRILDAFQKWRVSIELIGFKISTLNADWSAHFPASAETVFGRDYPKR